MRKDVSIHEREEVFEVDGEDRPWVCEGQTGKGEIKKGIKRERLRGFFFLLYAAWVRSRAERPSVSYTKVVMEVAWTGHNLQCKKTN